MSGVNWDVTALATEWVAAAPGAERSLALRGPAEYHARIFESRESAQPPRLIVNYTLPPCPPLTITCPTNIVANTDAGHCSKSNVTFSPSISGGCSNVTFACVPPSGSTFARGVTTVICSAQDSSGHSNSCSFTVTIRDTQLPAITCPANIVASADPGQCSKSNVCQREVPVGTML